MDILSHTLSGLAIGAVFAGRSAGNFQTKSSIIAFSGFGAILPDIDAISLWSKFDSIFGNLFNLQNSGKVIYSEKFWYSHHSFMHSLIAALLFSVIIGFLLWLSSNHKKHFSLFDFFCAKKLLLFGFISGFVIHLLEDMITPAGSWGGIRLFFPLKIYVGGTGQIWWWNNYNLFLIVVCVLIINLCILLIFQKNESKTHKFTTNIFITGCLCFIWQIFYIDYNFNGKNFAKCEEKSKEIQQNILGEYIYFKVEKLDNSLIIYF